MKYYFIYGKRTLPFKDENGEYKECDKQFRPLDYNCKRVNKLEDAICFAEKEDAQQFIDKRKWKKGTKIEIRCHI